RRVANRNNLNLTFDAHGSWERNLTPAVSSQFVTGLQVYSSTTKRNYGTGTNFPGPGIDVAGAGELQTVNESFLATRQMGVFGQEQLGFKEYLFATVGGRYDKHSAFGENAGGAFYPKVSLSFVPSDVPGWRGFGPVSSLRLRSALGRSGLQPGAFDKFTTFTPLASSSGPGLAPSNLGNPDLKPEVSTELEAGSEIGFWSDRAGIDFTYWHRTVDNVLIARQFEMSGGFRNPQLDNIGQMKAWGLELNGKALVINRPNLQLNLNANAAFLRERITDLGGAPPIKVDYVRYRIYLGEGYAPGSFFGPKVPGACSARPAGKTYTCLNEGEAPLDTNGDGKPDTKDQLLAYLAKPRSGDDVGRGVLAAMDDQADNIPGFYLGKNTPDWSGSFGGDLRVHKRWAINALFTYKFGNYYVHNLTYGFRRSSWRNIAESVRNEAVLLNPASTPEQRYDAAVEFATKLKALSPLDGLNEIEKADYLRFQELGLSYDVPASFLGRFGARSMTLSVKGRNLALFTGYSGVDPEANVVGLTEATTTTNQVSNNFLSGIDGWTLPLPRRVSFSARIGF
ncbi:MAG TPA: TonB-dependent receptor, partial [Longimicrobiales bacterium]|nr:TonB-dependent receptor [Longimicrobiales bacterium]